MYHAIEVGYNCENRTKTLLNHGANVNYLDKRGDYPAKMALETGNFEVLSILIKYGADVEKCIRDLSDYYAGKWNWLTRHYVRFCKCMDILRSASPGVYARCTTALIHALILGPHIIGGLVYFLKNNADFCAVWDPMSMGACDAAYHVIFRASSYNQYTNIQYTRDKNLLTLKLCFAAGAGVPSKSGEYVHGTDWDGVHPVRNHSKHEFMRKYLPECLDRDPVPDLQQACRKVIRDNLLKVNLPGNLFTFVTKLNLPPVMKSYLLYDVSLEELEAEAIKDCGGECKKKDCSVDRHLERAVGKPWCFSDTQKKQVV